MNNYIEIITIVPSKNLAKNIINELLEQKLICVGQINKINSTYSWKGIIKNKNEFRIALKTKIGNFDAIDMEIKKMHPYDTFELVSYEMKQGNVRFFNYIEETTQDM